jgi:hypothetical protein
MLYLVGAQNERHVGAFRDDSTHSVLAMQQKTLREPQRLSGSDCSFYVIMQFLKVKEGGRCSTRYEARMLVSAEIIFVVQVHPPPHHHQSGRGVKNSKLIKKGARKWQALNYGTPRPLK